MFEHITHENILNDALNEVDNNVDKREGAIIFDAISPHAKQLYELYFTMDGMIKEMFGDTASREFLIKLSKDRGITPNSATQAIRKGEFNINVPIGSRFSLDTLNFVVTEKISEGIFKLKCETSGALGNYDFGNIIPINYIDGLQTAILSDVLIPGEDEEPTEHLRKRYLESFDALAYGGNRKDYKDKVHSLQGVGGVKMYRVREGIYNVKVVVMDAQFQKPSSVMLENLQTAIDPEINQGEGLGIAPIGHIVKVDGVTETTVDFTFNITFDIGYDWALLELDIQNMVDDYFLELKKKWEDNTQIIIRIAQIESRALAINGVLDIQDTLINGKDENLAIDENSIPVRGVISE
ncbi:baseplate J/gp47 family protein [Lysinibacillus sp. NPDC058147]|uniref:baseplate J/gp47 family protein n=1 Tax=unclassified Lysinibacillus TaxID=2636778 RepID=UPI0036D9A37B